MNQPTFHARTPSEVREIFKREGVSLRAWATENNFNYGLVARVMGGAPATRGESREIAVALELAPPATGKGVKNLFPRKK